MEKKFLITAIDWSGSKKDPKNIYTLVSVEEKNYKKLKNYLIKTLDIKHWKKLTKLEKTRYTNKFLRKWNEIKTLIKYIDISFDQNIIFNNAPIFHQTKILIIDNTIFNKNYTVLSKMDKIILEGNVKEYYKPIILLSDNISNIFRKLYNETANKKKRYELLKRFRK